MIHHLRGISVALAENVFIEGERARKLRDEAASVKLKIDRFGSAGQRKGKRRLAPWLLYGNYNEPSSFPRFCHPRHRPCFFRFCSGRKRLRQRGCSRNES